jgi:predicted HicB family RNase H-like nuclease
MSVELQQIAALEVRITALEEKLAGLDAEWNRDFLRQIQDWDANFEDCVKAVKETRDNFYKDFYARAERVEDRLSERLSEQEKNVRASLDEYVQKLLSTSNSEVLASALRAALKSMVLKTRPATREELKQGDGLVFRNAGRGE